jgi:2-dehydro-3-deoxyphosphogluconate aldolase / (4S)-4-hydroxy-2-oxoglutarate aldolase
MMNSYPVMQQIKEYGVVAILRAESSAGLIDAAEAVLAGGVTAIEVALTTPGAFDLLRQARTHFGERMLFGVGTVLDPETARMAILTGTQFVVCPTIKPATVEMCRRYSIPVIPGAYTATEILTAWEAGADAVKLFPAGTGGPAYLKAIKGPLPHISLAAVGGVTVENTAEFIRAGSDFVGVGGELVNQKLLDAGNFAEITARAQRFRAEVAKGRSRA